MWILNLFIFMLWLPWSVFSQFIFHTNDACIHMYPYLEENLIELNKKYFQAHTNLLGVQTRTQVWLSMGAHPEFIYFHAMITMICFPTILFPTNDACIPMHPCLERNWTQSEILLYAYKYPQSPDQDCVLWSIRGWAPFSMDLVGGLLGSFLYSGKTCVHIAVVISHQQDGRWLFCYIRSMTKIWVTQSSSLSLSPSLPLSV